MANHKSRPGLGPIRKGPNVGPEYPEDRYRNPFNAGVDSQSGSEEHKTLSSPTDTPHGMGIGPLRKDYDKYWEEGK